MKLLRLVLFILITLPALASGDTYQPTENTSGSTTVDQEMSGEATAIVNMFGGHGNSSNNSRQSAPLIGYGGANISSPGLYREYRPALALSEQKVLYKIQERFGLNRLVYSDETLVANTAPYEIYLMPWVTQLQKTTSHTTSCIPVLDIDCNSPNTPTKVTESGNKKIYLNQAPVGIKKYVVYGTGNTNCVENAGKCQNVIGRSLGSIRDWVPNQYKNVYVLMLPSGNMGVEGQSANSGGGFSIGKLFPGFNASASIGTASQSGITKPVLGFVGATFILFVEDDTGVKANLPLFIDEVMRLASGKPKRENGKIDPEKPQIGNVNTKNKVKKEVKSKPIKKVLMPITWTSREIKCPECN